MLTPELWMVERAAARPLGVLLWRDCDRDRRLFEQLTLRGIFGWSTNCYRITEVGRAALRLDRNAARARNVSREARR